MGAGGSGGAEEPASSDFRPPPRASKPSAAFEARRLALLESGQLASLEAELGKIGAAPEITADEDAWVVLYDNSDSALTQRGWWLCERGGSWLLRVPEFGSDLQLSGYEDITESDVILERVGLVQHAEALRKGVAKSVERLLDRAGVTPFARMHCEKSTYSLRYTDGGIVHDSDPGVDQDLNKGQPLTLVLTRMRMDINCAEDQAVADLIFEKGAAARMALQVAVACFVLKGSGGADALVAAERELAGSLSQRGFKRYIAPMAAFPEAVAYLSILRPVHLRRLQRAQVPLM